MHQNSAISTESFKKNVILQDTYDTSQIIPTEKTVKYDFGEYLLCLNDRRVNIQYIFTFSITISKVFCKHSNLFHDSSENINLQITLSYRTSISYIMIHISQSFTIRVNALFQFITFLRHDGILLTYIYTLFIQKTIIYSCLCQWKICLYTYNSSLEQIW